MPGIIGPGGARPEPGQVFKRKRGGGFIPALVKAIVKEGAPGALGAANILAGSGSVKDAKEVGKALAKNLDPAKQFLRDPSLASGVGLAVSIPTRGLFGGTRFGLAQRLANEKQLVGPEKMMDMVKQLPPIPAKPRKGRAYWVDSGRAGTPQSTPEEVRRIIGVQDPASGTMYFTSGGLHHAELEGLLQRRHGIPQPEGSGYMQHEVFPAAPDIDVPSRMNFDVWGDDWLQGSKFGIRGGKDTRAATFARMRLLRNLKKQGAHLAPPSQNHGRWIGSP